MSRLENWYIDGNDQLRGQIYGDPRFPDGSPIITSRVVEYDKATGRARTKNANYELGKPLELEKPREVTP